MRELQLCERGSQVSQLSAMTCMAMVLVVALTGCLRSVGGDELDAAQTLAPVADAGVVADDAGQTAELGAPATTIASTQPEMGPRVVLVAEVKDDSVVVRVTLASFKELVGIASHLRYDPKGLRLTKVEEHKVLQSPGFSSRTVVRESPAGRVLMGAARYRIDTRPWDPPEGTTVGHQLWATLYFDVLSAGSHRLHFDPAGTLVKDASYVDIKASWGELTIHHVQEVK